MEKEYIERLIYEYNPKLANKIIELPVFKRELYSKIKKWLNKKQTIAITGLRRTGKTILMKQIMQELNNTAFFSFDEEETQTKETLVYVINYFINNLKAEFIFLDELHYVKDWEGVLKRYYDTKNIKFIISGSESLEIKKAKESLAGRIITFKLSPLNFREYLELKGKKVYIKERSIKDIYLQRISEREFYESEFLNYLYNGAFPEIVNEKDEEVIKDYINNLIVKKIIYRDLPRIFDIKRVDLLFSLFRYICFNSSNLFEIKNLCNILDANYETIVNYLFYLKESYLIKISELYSKSMAKIIRRSKKIYVTHPSIAFAVLGYKKEMVIEKILGQYVETLFSEEFFWRDKNKNEVDVVKDNKPIEIKYRSDINKKDLKGVFRFMKIFKSKEGIILTKDIFKEEIINTEKILFIPAWLFSLLKD